MKLQFCLRGVLERYKRNKEHKIAFIYVHADAPFCKIAFLDEHYYDGGNSNWKKYTYVRLA